MSELKYFLKDNPLTEDPTDSYGAVQHGKPVDDQELEEMILFRSTGVAKSDVTRVMEEIKIAMRYFLTSGRSLNTSLINASFSISGVFTDREDRFDPARHTLNLNIKPGVALQDVTQKVNLVKTTAPTAVPVVNSFTDTETGTKNQQFTPGGPAKVTGQRLKFDAEDPLQGVFFVAARGTKSYKVEKYVECQPSKLIFKIPAGMSPGTYRLEVRGGADKVGQLASPLSMMLTEIQIN